MKTITFNTDRKQLSFTKLSSIDIELRWRDVRGSYILSLAEAKQLRDYLNSVLECGHEKEIG